MPPVTLASQAEVRVRRAVAADAKDIWTWRNDPSTRAMSMTSAQVPWASHAEWYRASLQDDNLYLYVGCFDGDPRRIGMCRFDVDPARAIAEVSINLNPAMRGLGLSHRLLSAAIGVFLAERPVDLKATIRKQNAASVRCFTRCGFALVGQTPECGYYRLPAPSCARLGPPGIDQRDAGRLEIAGVAGGDGQAVDQGGGRNERISIGAGVGNVECRRAASDV